MILKEIVSALFCVSLDSYCVVGLLFEWFKREGAITAEETCLGFVLNGVVEGYFAVFVGMPAEDGDEVGGGFDVFEECCCAGQVARFGPALAAFDFVIAIGVIAPIGVAT